MVISIQFQLALWTFIRLVQLVVFHIPRAVIMLVLCSQKNEYDVHNMIYYFLF